MPAEPINVIQYGDLDLDAVTPGMLITHAKIPMAFTVALDNYLLPQAIALCRHTGQVERGEVDYFEIVNELSKELDHKSDLLGLFYSLEYQLIRTRSLIYVSAYWASRSITQAERICRISSNAWHLEKFLERIKEQHQGLYKHAALMDRKAYLKKSEQYELDEERYAVPI